MSDQINVTGKYLGYDLGCFYAYVHFSQIQRSVHACSVQNVPKTLVAFYF